MSPHRTPVVRLAPWYFAVLAALTPVAFWPSYVALPKGEFSGFHHVHAAAGVAWLALLIAQPMLASRGHVQAHRFLGRAGALVMAVLLGSFVGLSHSVLRGKAGDALAIEAYLSYLRLVAGAAVAGCFALALVYRKHTPVHSRLMICTGLPLVDPVVHRLAFSVLQDPGFNYQLLSWALVAATLGTFIWLDRHERAGRLVFPAFLAVFTVLFAPAVFKFWEWGGVWDAWQAAVRWFAHLPLTG
jgi:hypothetical protein